MFGAALPINVKTRKIRSLRAANAARQSPAVGMPYNTGRLHGTRQNRFATQGNSGYKQSINVNVMPQLEPIAKNLRALCASMVKNKE